MNPITRLEIYAGIGVILMAVMLGAYLKGRSDGAEKVQLKFDAFVSETKALGMKAEADKAKKEQADAAKIATAVTTRDAALASLRVAQSRARSGFVPNSTAGSKDSGNVCYDRPTLDAALRKLDTGVSNLVTEGDAAMINGRALLSSWPSAIPK